MIGEVIDEILKAEAEAAEAVRAADVAAEKTVTEARNEAEALRLDTQAEIRKLTMRAAAESDNAARAEAESVLARAAVKAEEIERRGEKKLCAAADFILKNIMES